MAQLAEVSHWAPLVTSAWTAEGSPARGPGARRYLRFAGVWVVEEVVAEWREDRLLAWEVDASPLPVSSFREVWSLDAASSGARLTTHVEYDVRLGAPGRVLDRTFVRPLVRWTLRRGQRALKRLVEGTTLAEARRG